MSLYAVECECEIEQLVQQMHPQSLQALCTKTSTVDTQVTRIQNQGHQI